jgi:predicted RNA-binding Zn-ribbon protein involved in translation (DUF1610 family)
MTLVSATGIICDPRFCRIRQERDKDISMPGSKITARGRNGYFRVSEIDAIVCMVESAQISVYSSRQGKTPPVVITGPLENMLKMLDEIRDALSSTKQGNSTTIELSSECELGRERSMVQLSSEDWIEIYYALQTKLNALVTGNYGEGDVDCDIEKWKLHLGSVIKQIGDDAEHAIRLGIAPVEITIKSNAREDCCPECGSDDITGSGSTETDGRYYWTDPSCNKCGSVWRQTYVLFFEGSEILERR